VNMAHNDHDDVLPEGWIQTSLANVAAINPGVNTFELPDSTFVSFIPMAAVEAGTGRINISEQRILYGVRRGYFFDKKPARAEHWTERLWVYDLRTNQNFTLRTNPLTRQHLDDFVSCYHLDNRHQRQETERFHSFSYDELLKRDKVSLDLFWLRDESLEDAQSLASPDALAASIVEDLQAALEQFAAITEDLVSFPLPADDHS
jgi:hypothetical protein